MIEMDLLYGKKAISIPGNEDRRSHTNDNEAQRTDANFKDRKINLVQKSIINMFIGFL